MKFFFVIAIKNNLKKICWCRTVLKITIFMLFLEIETKNYGKTILKFTIFENENLLGYIF